MLTDFLAMRLGSMRRIFIVMIAFGLTIGLVFPFVVGPFVTFKPERMIIFRFACLLAGLAVGSFCFYLVKLTLYQNNRLLARRKAELEDAKERFSSLTYKAIRTRDWSVAFEDPRLPTCWQLQNCEKAHCPAHGRLNVRCWLLAGTNCDGAIQGHFAQKLGNCAKCEIYREAVGEDPINEIGENFNSLMLAVKEKEQMLASAHVELKEKYGELELLHARASEMAHTDHLTGLRNHAYFQKQFRTEIKELAREKSPLALLMLDLDHFKMINDRFGHQSGDEVLKRLGAMLRSEIPAGFAARYGGEEFMAVLPGTGNEEAMRISDNLRIKAKQIAGETGLPPDAVALSIGVADFPHCASSPDDLISAADSALLFAKRTGRDRVVNFRELSEPDRCAGDIHCLNDRLGEASLQSLRSLAEAVDPGGAGAVAGSLAGIAGSMALQLGMKERRSEILSLAARLSDIGKKGISAATLSKKEKLSPEEISQVQRHPEIAQQILEADSDFSDLITAIFYHHERWDGEGYPEKLKGDEIPLMARIVGIMDAYRAMVTDRPYRKALDAAQALEELEQGAGSQFDPDLVKLFIELVREEPRRDSQLKSA